MNSSKLAVPLIILLVLVGAVAYASFFVVPEGQQVILTQFGKPVGKPYKDAGLYFKLPFIQKVNLIEKRILKWDGDPKQINTADKKYIFVDTTARWHIVEPLLYLQTVATMDDAQSRLDDIIGSVVNNAIAAHQLVELVRSANWKDMANPAGEYDFGAARQDAQDAIKEPGDPVMKVGRGEILAEMLKAAQKKTPEFGIEVIDLRIKKINYESSVQKRVFERMISERKRIASQYRSEGEGEKQSILGRMKKELAGIRSEAYRKAQEIRGQADAKATEIYGKAFGQDPQFYAMFKTLESYGQVPSEKLELILSTDGDYMKYIKSPQ